MQKNGKEFMLIYSVLFFLIAFPLFCFNAFSADGGFYLRFPLNGRNAYNAPISSVFDHSASSQYDDNNSVVAYTGEIGNNHDYGGTYECFNNAAGQQFSINGSYTGASSCGGAYYLCYDGHPGTDFQ